MISALDGIKKNGVKTVYESLCQTHVWNHALIILLNIRSYGVANIVVANFILVMVKCLTLHAFVGKLPQCNDE